MRLYLARARLREARLAAREGEPQDWAISARLGRYGAPRPKGPMLWFHAGHTDALRPLRELALRLADLRPELNFTITLASEPPGDDLLGQASFPPGTHILPAPLDAPGAVQRFFDHWRPDVALWVGADVAPALLEAASARDVVLFGCDGPRRHALTSRWRRLPGLARDTHARFAAIVTGDQASTALRRRLGAPPEIIEQIGYLEEGSAALSCDEGERNAIAAALVARPIWLATYVAGGELADVLTAHRAALRRSHRLLLVLSPADAARGDEVVAAANEAGLITAQRSKGDMPAEETQVYVADCEGEMGLWYRLAPISFLGRSIVPEGGHNPFEAAALGSAVLHGPNVRAHRESYARLAAAGAALLVRNAVDLASAVEQLLAPDKAAAMSLAAWEATSSGAEATDRLSALIFDALDERETP